MKARYAVLTIMAYGNQRYVVFDRVTRQIVNGVYSIKEDAIENALHDSLYGPAMRDMCPGDRGLDVFVLDLPVESGE